MRTNRRFLVPATIFAAALSILIAGCGDPQSTAPTATTVGNEIDDTVVTTKVKSALLGDPEIKSFDLKVETRKGVVQLSGFVDNQPQIDRAISTAAGVPGVSRIENGITLKTGTTTPGGQVDDGIITTKVKSALLADPGIKSFDIAVVTRKGEVQLSGYVDNQAQIDQAIAIAHKMEGVKSVGNEMSIKK